MSVINISMSAAGASAATAIPMSRINWNGTYASLLVNFSGQGAAGGTGGAGVATVQVSNDANANPSLTPTQQASARWNDLSCLADLEADASDRLDAPVAFVRLFVGTLTSGTITLQIGLPDDSSPANP